MPYRRRVCMVISVFFVLPGVLLAQDASSSDAGPVIVNPCFPRARWRVWRDDATPLRNVASMTRVKKQIKPITVTLEPTPAERRIYPRERLQEGEPIVWAVRRRPPREFAGVWDDVYASWSGLHGYVRWQWAAKDGSRVSLKQGGVDQIMHFVERQKTKEILRCGINFVHQSTTGMGHTLANSKLTAVYERIYFADCLVTAPAHASYSEDQADRTKDLFLAHVPTFFHSVGSSNSETMAITKMIIAGGYLPPATKRRLKQNGLYPSAMLYLWKAALPYHVPYDHELRHRIAYRSLGDERSFQGRYGHAGAERGNLALAFHRYDEVAHLRNMIRMAQDMDVPPPEAVFDRMEVEGGKVVYKLHKSALILQEPGEDITIRVSTDRCYDLDHRPLQVRWKLLYGTPATTCRPDAAAGRWVIRVPWDGTLPEGRTAIALIANNGRYDSNPAIITIFRKKYDLPPSGWTPRDYKYDSPYVNRRPVLIGLQDEIVRPGQTVELDLHAVDPEGQPVRFYRRAGEPGELDGSRFRWHVPRRPDRSVYGVTIMASDGSAGNSYTAQRVHFVIRPAAHAHITVDRLVGRAPFTVDVSAKGSTVARGPMEVGWEFYRPTPKRTATPWEKQQHQWKLSHVFTKPGRYEIALTVKGNGASDRQILPVWVTDGKSKKKKENQERIIVAGNGVAIRNGNDTPSRFDHTDFGIVPVGKRRVRRFELFNQTSKQLELTPHAVRLTGSHATDFQVKRPLRGDIASRGYATFEIAFAPRACGMRSARVEIDAGSHRIEFTIRGNGRSAGR